MVHPPFPQPEKAFELFETALEEVVGRTRNAILADKTAPAQVVRDSLADLADIQAQCRIIGEAKIGSGDQVPEMLSAGDELVPEIGRSAGHRLEKRSLSKKDQEEPDQSVVPAKMGRQVDKPRQRRTAQQSTPRS